MPYRDNKRGIRVAPNRRFRRLDGNAFTDATPQGWIVVAEQNWLDGLSDTPAETAGTENDNRRKKLHFTSDINSTIESLNRIGVVSTDGFVWDIIANLGVVCHAQ
jgi:hypothetical protein